MLSDCSSMNPRYNGIEKELEDARSNLKDINKKIYGQNQMDRDRKRPANSFESNRRNDRIDRNDGKPDQMRPAKLQRRDKDKSVFSRLSVDDFPKPKVSSRVHKEQPSREYILATQAGDEQSRARNKRMFGSLLGTLQKFCQEESKLKPTEEKKAKIEQKLEQQEALEKEKVRIEKQSLFGERKRKQLEIKLLEIKMYKLKDLAAWEESKKPLVNFIKTKTRPCICYLPKKMNAKSEEKLAQSKIDAEKLVEKRRKEVHDEIKQIETRFMNDIKAIEEGKIVKEEDFDLEFIDEHKIYTNSDNAENNENRTTKVKEEIRHSSEENEPILKSTIGNNFQKHTVN